MFLVSLNNLCQVCNGRVMDLFKAEELMAMVVGNEDYDWEELEGSTQYKEGYSADHPTIVNFWSVFHNDLSLEDKKKFLLFLTGCDRIPVGGMKALALKIQVCEGGGLFFSDLRQQFII